MKNENGTLTLNVLKNRYGDSKLIQKYDVDFGINKYKPIQEFNMVQNTSRQARAKQMFSGLKTF